MIRDQELSGLAMTLGRDAKMTITVGGDGSYCTSDGSHINIARMPATPLGRMLMTGLVFHEVGHKNHTKGDKPDGLLGDMMNVIEDVRVDMETMKRRPGTCFNLEAITTYYFNKGSLAPQNFAHAFLGKVMAYGFGRVLKQKCILSLEAQCNEMIDDAFGQEFIDNVETIIKEIPELKSTKDTAAMAQRLIDLLISQSKPAPPQSPTAGKPQQGAQGTASGSRVGSQCRGGNGEPERALEKGAIPSGSTEATDMPAEPEEQSSTGCGGSSAGSGKDNRPTTEEIARMLANKTGYGDLSELIKTELDQIARSIPHSTKVSIPLLPVVGQLRPVYGRLDEVEAISASSRMRARLMGMLQAVQREPKTYGLSGRKLASARLTKLATGDPRIFRRKVDTPAVNTAVAVLLDLSGSMSNRYRVANAAAFALHTTLYGLRGVAVCSLEFSGKSKGAAVNVLVDFGRKPHSEHFNHPPFASTPTDKAIWAARARLLQRVEPRRIMLILTDGCPDNEEATRAATRRATRDGIETAAIGIMHDGVKDLWENHRVIHAIHELPAAMFGVMEHLLTHRR
ncbi:hypothetical protein KP003_02880 [Geomonas nitrogeniifigens]|uniref:hypothetical protein n=1 Tax=Geomonas diazotrophica TaxID=2843197 RepID=UPI001C2C69C2|nr:hypothetical protein [Geomonas nitrogeniifigens]QXE87369.1 hypothetical protein KP003_02880 [Geomonas nitrogeniifigens]